MNAKSAGRSRPMLSHALDEGWQQYWRQYTIGQNTSVGRLTIPQSMMVGL